MGVLLPVGFFKDFSITLKCLVLMGTPQGVYSFLKKVKGGKFNKFTGYECEILPDVPS